jgi:hypothetical protein
MPHTIRPRAGHQSVAGNGRVRAAADRCVGIRSPERGYVHSRTNRSRLLAATAIPQPTGQ